MKNIFRWLSSAEYYKYNIDLANNFKIFPNSIFSFEIHAHFLRHYGPDEVKADVYTNFALNPSTNALCRVDYLILFQHLIDHAFDDLYLHICLLLLELYLKQESLFLELLDYSRHDLWGHSHLLSHVLT